MIAPLPHYSHYHHPTQYHRKPRLHPPAPSAISNTTTETENTTSSHNLLINSFDNSLSNNLLKYQHLTWQYLQVNQKYQICDAEIYVTCELDALGENNGNGLPTAGNSTGNPPPPSTATARKGPVQQQQQQQPHSSSSIPARLTIKIQGHLHLPSNSTISPPPFTSVINNLLISFPKEVFGKSMKPIEWRRSSGFVDCDGFTIVNNSIDLNLLSKDDFKMNIQIGLGASGNGAAAGSGAGTTAGVTSTRSAALAPLRLYRTTKKLTALLYGDEYVRHNEKHGQWRTQHQIMQELWQYIQIHQLQSNTDSKMIDCNERLKRLVHSDSILVNELYHRLSEHLIPSDAIHIKYTVHPQTPSKNQHEQLFIRKIPIQQQDSDQYNVAHDPSIQRKLDALEAEIAEAKKLISHHKEGRKFMEKFAMDPVNHIYEVICDQSFHLQMMNNQLEDESRYSSFWKKPWVNDAVDRALNQEEGLHYGEGDSSSDDEDDDGSSVEEG